MHAFRARQDVAGAGKARSFRNLFAGFSAPIALVLAAVSFAAGLSTNPGLESKAVASTQSEVLAPKDSPVAHDARVGKLAGEGDTSGGAAVYTVPIAIPPGRAGMQPSVSLTYSSRSGDGIAGIGWSLAASSAIHRCPQTVAQDGRMRGVAFDGQDRLCLDGQRLVPEVQGAPYGVSGTIYRTEIDQFARITQLGASLGSTSGDACFRVEDKSGRVRHFGAVVISNNTCSTDSSRHARTRPGFASPRSGANGTLSWMLEKEEDRVGNNIFYAYADYGNGETLLSNIDYTGFGATAGNRTIEFSYVDRSTVVAGASDRSASYLAGGLSMQTRALSEIATWAGAELVRTVSATYVASGYSGRLWLDSLEECGYTGAQATCHPETEFKRFDQNPPQFAFRSLENLSIPGIDTQDREIHAVKVLPDFSGDGAREALITVRQNPSNPTQYTDQNFLAQLTPDRAVQSAVDVSGMSLFSPPGTDFDGDGRAEILLLPTSGNGDVKLGVWGLPRGVPAISNPFVEKPTSIVGQSPHPVPWEFGVDLEADVADVDGDGRSDLLVTRVSAQCLSGSNRGGVFVYRNANPPGAISSTVNFKPAEFLFCLTKTTGGGTLDYEEIDHIADYDGDGLPDFFIARRGSSVHAARFQGVRLTRLTGSSLTIQAKTCTGMGLVDDPNFGSTSDECNWYRGHVIHWMDVNGDGLEDFVIARLGGTWHVRLNKGGSFGAPINTGSMAGLETAGDPDDEDNQTSFRYAGRVPPLDVDSDGKSDLLVVSGTQGFAMKVCSFFEVPEFQPMECPLGSSIESDPNSPLFGMCAAYACPEEPGKNWNDAQAMKMPGDQLPTYPWEWSDPETGRTYPVLRMYASNGSSSAGIGYMDDSLYHLAMLKFEQTGPDAVAVRLVETPMITNLRKASGEDLYGDGLVDILTMAGGPPIKVSPTGRPNEHHPSRLVVADGTYGPSTLPDGTAICVPDQGGVSCPLQAHNRPYISENMGSAPPQYQSGSPSSPIVNAQPPYGPAPPVAPSGNQLPFLPDLMQGASDGLEDFVSWGYVPLALPLDFDGMPLYTLPSGIDQGYADGDHYYFTSSMPVVYGMTRSDGVGGQYGFRQAVYGYEEAMYNHRGRGFQGFRTVSSLSGPDSRLRTTTRFHQKFPLTGRIESVEVAYPESPNLPISVSEVTWRCERSDRNQPCPGDGPTYVAPVPGNIYAPFLDTQVDRTYDLPPPDSTHGLVKTVTTSNALNATTSAWDAYGNLLKQAVTTSDGGSGGTFVQSHVLTTESDYSISTASGNWWVDKLNWRTVDSSVTYHPINHALPGSASNPQRTRRTDYTWNPDRTPATQIVQSGISGQESAISYVYPSPSYGLPSSVTTLAPSAAPSTRTTSFTYTNNGTTQQADGYFVLQATNPLLQTTTTETRPRDGQVSRTITPNNLRTVTAYDVFGRPKQVNHRGWNGSIEVDIEPATYISLTDCDFAGGTGCMGGYGEGVGEEHAAYRQTTVKAGTPTQVTWFDNLGRVVKQSTRSFNNASFVQVRTEYSNIGKISRQSTPHVSSPYWTKYDSYDRLDRLTAKTAPAAELDPLNGNRTTTYTYTGTRTDILVKGSNVTTTDGCPINELCMEMSRFYDALGRLVKTLDANNQPTSFWYDGTGNPIAIKSPEGHLTLGSYDHLGRRINRTDPDAGFASFTYDGFGQVLTATDARLVQTTMTYDALGRMVGRSSTNPAGAGLPAENVLDTWVYDPIGNPGALDYAKRQRGTSAPLPEVWRQTNDYYEIDKRPEATSIWMEGESVALSFGYAYDAFGRPDTVSYPNGDMVIRHGYNSNGYTNALIDATTGFAYWTASAQDPWGNVTHETYGNGVIGSHQAYASTGQLHWKNWTTGAAAPLDRLDYAYDSFGNLKSQTRTIQGVDSGTESYEYDSLQRLTGTALSGNIGQTSATTAYQYTPDGNIQFKSDANNAGDPANYIYGGAGCGPHAITKIAFDSGSIGHSCDANGNDVGPDVLGGNDTAVYDFMNLPRRVENGDFQYDANGNRYRGETPHGTTVYGPAGYERTAIGRTHVQRLELGPVIVTLMSGGDSSPTYALRDRLGSTTALARSNREALETRSYDAFGRVRDGNFGRRTDAKLGLEVTTLRGFTQHEHLDGGLIHMNGRMYDSLLGRFKSVDPIIQFPSNSQSLNPYSYVMNNPLAGMDPSGYANLVDAEAILEVGESTTIDTRDSRSIQKVGNYAKVTNEGGGNVTISDRTGGRLASIALGGNGGDTGLSTKGAASSPKDQAGKGSSDIGRTSRMVESALDSSKNSYSREKQAESRLSGAQDYLGALEARAITDDPLVRLGAHTTQEHSWLSLDIYDWAGGAETHTFGLWQDTYTLGKGLDLGGRSFGSVYIDVELQRNYASNASTYFYLQTSQTRSLFSYIRRDPWYSGLSTNCSTFVTGAIRSSTGVNLPSSFGPIDLPSVLQESINMRNEGGR